MANTNNNNSLPLPVNVVQLVTQAASSTDETLQYTAVASLRNILASEEKPPIDLLIQQGILPILVNCLKKMDNPALQYEAAWVLGNIAGGTPQQTHEVIVAGTPPLFVQLVYSEHENLREQGVLALGNIFRGDNPQLRDYLIDSGILVPMFLMITPSAAVSVLRNIARLITNLCRNMAPPLSNQVLRAIAPAVKVLATHSDTNILLYAALTLYYMAQMGHDKIQIILDSGVIPQLVTMLPHSETEVQSAAIHTIGNIVTGSIAQTQVVIDCGALQHFPILINHSNMNICRIAIWATANIAAGDSAQVQAVIDAGLLPLIIPHFEKEESPVKMHAAMVIYNMTSETTEQVAYLINCGVIPHICSLLSYADVRTIKLGLDSINNILIRIPAELEVERVCIMINNCGGVAKIKLLQTHENSGIATVAQRITKKYFPGGCVIS